MRKFIILASLVACCVAAPTLQQTSKEQQDHSVLLQRPSPINPDVPSDPKPPEKIIKITDPKEIIKHKRETEDDPYNHISRFAPTAHPARQAEKQHSHESEEKHPDPTHHREKREKGQVKDTRKPAKAPVPPAPANKAAVKNDSPKRSRSQSGPPKSIVPTPAPARDLPKHRQRRQVDPHLLGASTVGVTPLIYQDDDKKSDEAEAQHEVKSSEESTESTVKPATHESTQVKRDIPVPLVPKYHHPEESPNSDNQEGKVEAVKNNERHPNDDDSKSDESDEDSNEQKPAPAIQIQQPHNQSGQALLAQQHQIQIPAQPSHPDIENNKPVLSLTPAAEHDKPNEVHNNGEPIEVHPHVGQQHQTQTSAQPSHAGGQNDKPEPENPQHQHKEEPATEQNEPNELHNNESVLEQLAGIKPTQIINYETPASEITVPIKHPVPVAELFSRPKQ